MLDDTPYIIVDNQKIAPIRRIPRPESVIEETGREWKHNFGVVDRVTISREGLIRSRQLVNEKARQPVKENRSQRLTASLVPMLTYSPTGRR